MAFNNTKDDVNHVAQAETSGIVNCKPLLKRIALPSACYPWRLIAPGGTKPLFEPLLTYHQRCSLTLCSNTVCDHGWLRCCCTLLNDSLNICLRGRTIASPFITIIIRAEIYHIEFRVSRTLWITGEHIGTNFGTCLAFGLIMPFLVHRRDI